jgi:hypothetical protein
MLCKKALNSTAMSAAVVASQIWLSLKSSNGCPSIDNTAMDRNTSSFLGAIRGHLRIPLCSFQ